MSKEQEGCCTHTKENDMENDNKIAELTNKLRAEKGVRCVIVWLDKDAEERGKDADDVEWELVEEKGIQAGWEVIL